MRNGRQILKRTSITIVPLLTAMILLSFSGASAEVEVKARDFEFVPRDITIPAGETVKWVWEEGFHTVTSGTGDSDPQSGNLFDAPLTSNTPTFSFQFNNEGVFPYFCIPHEFLDMKGTVTVQAPTGVGDDTGSNSGELPRAIVLSQNYPNPFNPSTTFTVKIPDGETHDTVLKVYDTRGKLVGTVVSGKLSGGEYHFGWDGKSNRGEDLPSGIYLYRLEYGSQSITKKMTMLK